MTRDELIRELRSRFIERRAAFPELCEMVRYLSGDRLLESYSRCGACRKMHITPEAILSLAAASADVAEWEQRVEAVCQRQFPAACKRKLERVEAEFAKVLPS